MSSSSFSWFGTLTALAVPVTVAVVYAFVRRQSLSRNKPGSPLRRNSISHSNFLVVEEKAANAKLIANPQVMGTWTSLGLEQPLVIAMVGLPARGKSYIVKMLVRYLKWNGYDAEVFNVGSYRRQRGLASADAAFFSADNTNAQKLREEMAMHVLDSLYSWLHEPVEGSKGRVGIFDATNTTRARRLTLAERARRENVFLLFVESICDDESVLQRNYALKLNNDDYKKVDQRAAMKDFIERVQAYEKVYETVEDNEDNSQVSYIKLINVGQKVITRNCTGYVPSQVAFYLQNIHILPRKIYLTLNSEVQGSDSVSSPGSASGFSFQSSRLSEAGLAYSLDLAKYIYSRQEAVTDLSKAVFVLAGTTSVHAETILHLRNLFPCFSTTLLNDLRVGDKDKEEWQRRGGSNDLRLRRDDSFVNREDYRDIIERIRPVIIELERQRRTVVVVCHISVLRCIYAYFMGTGIEDIGSLHINTHTLYELTPGPFGCTCSEIIPAEEMRHM